MGNPATQHPVRMTSEEFLLWALDQPGRYELVDGIPVEMQAERNRHVSVKTRVVRALDRAIERAGVPCEAWTDGAAVRIDAARTRQPDAVVTCGVDQDDEALALAGAIIVVEVLSPTNSNTDKFEKLADYGRVPGLCHYLIVHPVDRFVIHHHFTAEEIVTRVLPGGEAGGELVLDPPGLRLPVSEFFPPTRAAE